MSYRTITVCLDNSAGSGKRLEFALSLAAQHGAHLTGFHLSYTPVFLYDPYGQFAPLAMEWEIAADENRKRSEEAFGLAAQRAGVNFDWSAYRGNALRRVIGHVRSTDLAIVGQRDPDDDQTYIGEGFPEAFVLKVGRPVLFLPYAGGIPRAFENVIVAWDGGREATRAVGDALPLLRRARRVRVLSALRRSAEDDGDDLPDIDIGTFLSRHDVRAEIEKINGLDIEPAQWLLSRAADYDAHLLVMGAYGHNRLSELVLGGVTRTLLREMTLPVLMSH